MEQNTNPRNEPPHVQPINFWQVNWNQSGEKGQLLQQMVLGKRYACADVWNKTLSSHLMQKSALNEIRSKPMTWSHHIPWGKT